MAYQTNERFLEILKERNPNILPLSKYISDKAKISCKCKICGHEWEDSATHLKLGRSCSNCKKIKRLLENAKLFFEKARAIHNNKYDYSKFIYIDSYTKGTIICPEHGEFQLIPNSHINGRGCPKCAGNNIKRNSAEFIEKARLVHGDKYDYSKVEYKTCKDKVQIKCNRCGKEFFQAPDHHLLGLGCPNCKLVSLTELYDKLRKSFPLETILFEVNNKVVLWLGKQRFDMYFPKYNIAIEYNGILHYIPVQHFGGKVGFDTTVNRDTIKRRKCIENNCNLLEVKYNYTNEDYNLLVNNINNIILLKCRLQ